MKIYSFLIMITIGFLFPYGAQGNTPRVTGSSSAYRVVERIPVEPIWLGTSVGYCLLTHENHQFIAYYDANRQMTVAQRSLDSKDWTFKNGFHQVGPPITLPWRWIRGIPSREW